MGLQGERRLSRPLYKGLDRRGAQRLRDKLSVPAFAFLGRWRLNATFLQELSTRLVAGEPVLIDGFLADGVAQAVVRDTFKGVHRGWLRPIGTHMNSSGVGDVTSHSLSADELCQRLDKLEAKMGFKFQFHVLDPRGKSTASANEFLGHMRLFAGITSAAWREALVTLLTGSPDHADKADFELPYFREFASGDYATLHNDLGGASRRVLCLNYWFPSIEPRTSVAVMPSWTREQGGTFLWCGAAANGGRMFPAAARTTPAFNQANLFIPRRDSWHAVELVTEPARQHASSTLRRFSFTSWLELPEPIARHLENAAGDESAPIDKDTNHEL